MATNKSLTEAAKDVLQGKSLEEGYGINYPSVGNGSVSNPNPVDGSTASTGNAKTLRPSGGTGQGAEADPKHNEAEDLGGSTPTSLYKDNLGAKAAKKGRDKSVKGSGKDQAPAAHLEEDEEIEGETVEENTEISEELEAFIEECIEAGLNEDEIAEAIEENFELVSEEQEEELEEELEEEYEEEPAYEVDMREHVEALLEGENLSEEFKEKATTIFEAAVKAKIEEEVALLEQAYAETLEERVSDIVEQLTTDVDNYLNYVVEQWVEENEVAIESTLRSELTEEFISGLRSLFAEHYIDVPEESVNVVEELSSTVEELEAKLNEEIERGVQLRAALNESVKQNLVDQISEGLTVTQAEKLRSLAENVTFTTEDEFAEKVSTLRESYFPASVNSDEVLDRVDSHDPQSLIEANLEGPMARYVQTLGRSLPK